MYYFIRVIKLDLFNEKYLKLKSLWNFFGVQELY